MATTGKTPDTGARSLTFCYDGVRDGTERTGFLSGPIHGIECHPGRPSRPCLRLLCGDSASCPECDRRKSIEWLGYTPLRREDGKPVCIVLRRHSFNVADRIQPGARVRWGKDKGDFESVYLLERQTGHVWGHWYGDRKPDDSMVEWLAILWKMPTLIPHLRRYFGEQSDNALTPAIAETGVLAVPVPTSREEVNAAFAREVRKRETSKNGKH